MAINIDTKHIPFFFYFFSKDRNPLICRCKGFKISFDWKYIRRVENDWPFTFHLIMVSLVFHYILCLLHRSLTYSFLVHIRFVWALNEIVVETRALETHTYFSELMQHARVFFGFFPICDSIVKRRYLKIDYICRPLQRK